MIHSCTVHSGVGRPEAYFQASLACQEMSLHAPAASSQGFLFWMQSRHIVFRTPLHFRYPCQVFVDKMPESGWASLVPHSIGFELYSLVQAVFLSLLSDKSPVYSLYPTAHVTGVSFAFSRFYVIGAVFRVYEYIIEVHRYSARGKNDLGRDCGCDANAPHYMY